MSEKFILDILFRVYLTSFKIVDEEITQFNFEIIKETKIWICSITVKIKLTCEVSKSISGFSFVSGKPFF